MQAGVLLIVLLKCLASLISCQTSETTCADNCRASATTEAICQRRAQNSLRLICDYPYVSFKRLNDNQTITSLIDGFFSDDNNYQKPTKLNELVINKLRAIDSGRYSFRGINFDDETNPCNFSIYAYDTENESGSIKFGSSISPLDSIISISFNLESFKQELNYTYKYEALPLDYLTVDDRRVEGAKKCRANVDWLNCYESTVQLDIRKCQNELKLNLSYGFDNADNYVNCESNQNKIQSKFYEKTINLNYPPLVSKNRQDVYFTKLKQDLDLECKVECANPLNLIYRWYSSDNLNAIIQESAFTDALFNKYTFKVDAQSESDVYEVICIVSNSINTETDYKNDSITRFVISYRDPSDPSISTTDPSGSTEWPGWLIAVVAVVSIILLAVIIALVLVILLCQRTKKDSEESNSNKTSPRANNNVSFIEMEQNNNSTNINNKNFIRPHQQPTANQDLTNNPVYGNVYLQQMKNENSQATSNVQSPTSTRSDNSSSSKTKL